jgi:hypothetical protein
MRRYLFALLITLSANAQDAATTIKNAEYALGMIRGAQRVDAINTVEYWGTGTVAYHASVSYAVPAMRVDITRGGQRQIQVVSGGYAWNESVPGAGFIPGSTATPAPYALKDRLLELWTTPFGALKMAERAGANAKVTRVGATVITFPLMDIIVKATLNAKNQLARVETPLIEISYSDYKDLGEITSDVLFPTHIVEKQRGVTVLDLTISKVDANNPYVVFPVPDAVEKAPPARSR